MKFTNANVHTVNKRTRIWINYTIDKLIYLWVL